MVVSLREITDDNREAVCALRVALGERHQRRGFGRAALAHVIDMIRADGGTELLTSYQPGDGEPWPFYRRFGFEPTGDVVDGEIVLRLPLSG